MKALSKDARGFVESVTSYIKSDAHAKQVLPKVQSLLTKVTSAAKRERIARVTSVVALSQTEKSQVDQMIDALLGHNVECSFSVNPSLLGGLRIQVADWVIDTSLESQLTMLTRSLV